VIIGKLIPAGTGMNRYRDIATHAPDYEPLPFYSSDADSDGDLDLAAWLADTSASTIEEQAPAFPLPVSVPDAGGAANGEVEAGETGASAGGFGDGSAVEVDGGGSDGGAVPHTEAHDNGASAEDDAVEGHDRPDLGDAAAT
jgi:hypothetical protein